MISKEEGYSVTSMVGEKRSCRNRSRAYYWRKCERESGANIDSLPDELLLEILARLSDDPDYLYNKARLVCRRWRHLIHSRDFFKTQLHRSTYGLLFCLRNLATSVTTATQGRMETSEILYDISMYSRLQSSCNGLALLQRRGKPMRIMNPVIKRKLVLPSFSCEEYETMIHTGCGIGYAADSMEYKVVLPYLTVREEVFLAILSVGIDKSWRHVGVEHLSVRARNHLHHFPLVTEGFITWPYLFEGSYLTLDVQTEILTLHPSPLPEACLVGTCSFYLSTGRSLSLLVVHKFTKYLMELWEMKAESGEWRKVAGDIKLGAHARWLEPFSHHGDVRDAFLKPLGWVRYPEVLALRRCGSSCIFFNLNTQQISSMELPREVKGYYISHVHKKSLAWFS